MTKIFLTSELSFTSCFAILKPKFKEIKECNSANVVQVLKGEYLHVSIGMSSFWHGLWLSWFPRCIFFRDTLRKRQKESFACDQWLACMNQQYYSMQGRAISLLFSQCLKNPIPGKFHGFSWTSDLLEPHSRGILPNQGFAFWSVVASGKGSNGIGANWILIVYASSLSIFWRAVKCEVTER